MISSERWKRSREGGRPAIPVRSMVLCCLFKYKFKYDYQGLEPHLNAHKDLLKLMGLKNASSKSSIHIAMARLPIPRPSVIRAKVKFSYSKKPLPRGLYHSIYTESMLQSLTF